MTHALTAAILGGGYLAVFVLMIFESACIPIPSEVIMLFGGALANAAFVTALHSGGHPLNFVLVGLLGTAGNVVGSWIAWWAGYAGGRPFVSRWGRYVLLRQHELDRAQQWFDRRGTMAVFVSRLLPGIRTFISLPAGFARMPFGRFTAATVLGSLPWTFGLAAIGYAIGANWTAIAADVQLISIVIAVIVIAVIAWWVARQLSARRASSARTGR